MCYDKYAKEEEKMLAMLNAKYYKMLRALVGRSVEREFAKNPKFMELYDMEAYESAVRRELKQQGLDEGWAFGLDKCRIERFIINR